jgi:DNA-binding MarR family transcriptional regulator
MPQVKKQRAQVLRAIESLQRLAELFRERRLQLASRVGLSEVQWRVLEEIAGENFMPSMFARRRERTPAAVSRTLRQLLDRSLVSAEISDADARQRNYRLTAAGRELIDDLEERRERAIGSIWSEFTPEELDGFRQFSDELSARLEAYRD